MRKPKWATKAQKRYKIVTAKDSKSWIQPRNRPNACTGYSGVGVVGRCLTYEPKTRVISPNGICRIKDHVCCRGIHAFASRSEAELQIAGSSLLSNIDPLFKVIAVYARTWHMSSSGYFRAGQVYVK